MGMMLDTLKLAERLQAGGFTPEQSKTAAAFAESIGDWFAAQQLATKVDLAQVESALKTDLAAVKAALRTDLAAVEAALRTALVAVEAALRTDLTAVKADLRTGLAEVKADLVKWVVGIGFAQVAMILAVIKLM